MATWILHGNVKSYFYVDSITKILTTRPDMTSQYNNISSHLLKRHHKNGEIIKNSYACRNNIDVTCH